MGKTILFGEPMALLIADTTGPLENVEHFTRALSGAEVNVSIGLTRLGHSVEYLTRLGDDPFGHYIAKTLGENQIGISLLSYDPVYRTGIQLKNRVTDGSDPYAPYYRKGSAASHISEKEIANFRREHLGFVFQDFNLLDNFNNRDNIFLPLVLSKKKYPEMKKRLEPIAKQLGIEGILDKFPYEISGGQKQRVAVARAIITNPDLILADEPTGALDSKSTEELLHLFGTINANQQTIVMVTHSTKAASHASRVLFIKDGKIFHEIYKGNKNLDQMYQCISDTLTLLATGGVHHE